jgi:hypothetical protein
MEDSQAFGSREERVAFNEAFCRDLNERKVHWMRSNLPTAGFRCECADVNCGVRFRLSQAEWNEVRSRPTRFAVAPSHFVPDVEEVVKEYPEFWIVEKRGEAGDIAEELT